MLWINSSNDLYEDLTVHANIFNHAHTTAIYIDGQANPTINHCDFTNINSFGIQNNGSKEINAINNYWDLPSGPYHPELNPDGEGCHVSDNVIFEPWLQESISITPPPQDEYISNIAIQQRTDGSGLIDVFFDLVGSASNYLIIVEISLDSGNSYSPVGSSYLQGDTGPLAPGAQKHIVLDLNAALPNEYSTNAKLKIIATNQ